MMETNSLISNVYGFITMINIIFHSVTAHLHRWFAKLSLPEKSKIMFGKLNNGQIEKVITDNYIGRLGCHADGKTYVVPISYAYDGQFVYARTFEGLKISMMRKNPKVCFQIDEMENMANWKSVVAWGTFEELLNENERNQGLQILVSRMLPEIASETVKLSPQWPFPTDDFSKIKGIIFRIKITEKTGRCEIMDTSAHAK
ncbi:MAG: pyridoxamine 5'-phosphate oxidase family protein [Ginsengibacter sp.]